MKRNTWIRLAVGLFPWTGVSQAADIGTAFTYQGQLKQGGAPLAGTADFRFTLWDTAGSGNPPTGGTQVGGMQSIDALPVTAGLFTVALNPTGQFGANAFNGEARWVQIAVRSPAGGGGVFTTLAPRQPITATPYALRAAQGVGPPGVLNVTPTGNVGIGMDDASEALDVGGNIHATGEIRSGDGTAALDGAGNRVWSSAHLELHVGTSQRALRLEPNATSPNIIGGYVGNSVPPIFCFPDPCPSVGATISGGGSQGEPNTVWMSYGTIGGGLGNSTSEYASTVGGGFTNTAIAAYSTVGGGVNSAASGQSSTVGGGEHNYAGSLCSGGPNDGLPCVSSVECAGALCPRADYSTVGGGVNNRASWPDCTVGGGKNNTATGGYAFEGGQLVGGSTVGGGENNFALAQFSTVGGGYGNVASGNSTFIPNGAATVGGGRNNVAGGMWSTVPGGANNEAVGTGSLAAGQSAKAHHDGTFVWADANGPGITSTAPNQFLIDAAGGVGIGTNTPDSILHVKNFSDTGGAIRVGANSTALATRIVRFGDGDFCTIGESTVDDDDMRIQAENVGIKRDPLINSLEVEGDASKTTAGLWNSNSDRRIKKNIETIGSGFETLDKVRLVSFEYTDEYRAAHPSIEERTYVNVIAQEFAEVFPDYVKGSGEKVPSSDAEILQVDPYPLTIYSAAAIRELHGLAIAQQAEIAALRVRLANLERGDEQMKVSALGGAR